MVEQYKLRLGDGTILAVDHDGLRTWLLDAKAMVQAPGSRRWRPLRQHLAEEPAPPVRRPEPAAPPPSAPRIAEAPIIPPKPVDQAVRSRRPVLTSLAESTAPRDPQADDGIAIIPFKPLDDDEPPFHVGSEPGQSLLDVAVAEVERHGGRDDVWQWNARDTRGVAATRPEVASRPAAEPEARDEEEVLEELELDAEGQAVHARPSSAPGLDPPASVAPTHLPEQTVPPATVPPAVEAVLRHVSSWLDVAIRRVRRLASPPGGEPATSLEAATAPRDALPPPPAISELPTLRFAPMDDEGALPSIDRARMLRVARTWAPRGLLAAAAIAAVVVATTTRARWMPRLSGLSGSTGKAARPLPPPPATRPEPPPLPKEVQLAIAQLPHLSPETVQLVMSKAERGLPDPAEVFRRAHAAANRGASVLTEEEAQELGALKSGVLAALSRADRDRVRAYDRMSPVRDLLVSEDSKVMVVFTRGVRALSPPRRERIQALLAKAITAELGPRTPMAQAVR